jgi:hypothetical protein
LVAGQRRRYGRTRRRVGRTTTFSRVLWRRCYVIGSSALSLESTAAFGVVMRALARDGGVGLPRREWPLASFRVVVRSSFRCHANTNADIAELARAALSGN